MMRRPSTSSPFPYTTLFRSGAVGELEVGLRARQVQRLHRGRLPEGALRVDRLRLGRADVEVLPVLLQHVGQLVREQSLRSEEHTSELQSHVNLVCRLLLEKK